MSSPFLGLFLALVAGAVLPLAFAPFAWVWLQFVSLVVLFWLWRNASGSSAAWVGWFFGVGVFGVGVSWVYISIHDMGHLSVALAGGITLLLVASLALYPACLGWLAARFFVLRSATGMVLALPAGWVLFEWLRGSLFTGFAWLWLGHAQVDGPLGQLLPVSGSLGASWLVALSSAVVVHSAFARGYRRWLPLVAIAVVWSLASSVPFQRWTSPGANALSFSLVQGGRPQQLRWESGQRVAAVNEYLGLTNGEWGRDLVVWPENALPMFHHQVPGLRASFDRLARENETVLLVGMPYLDRASGDYFNSVVAFPEPGGRYDKHHLVPFTEFLPFKRWLKGPLDFFQVPMSDFSSGPGRQGPILVGDHSVGVSICYEAAFARDALATLPEAGVLVNLSNDGWFGDSLGPHQHLQLARVRALEGGRQMLRATNNGITAHIDEFGRLLQQAKRFQPAVLRGEVRPMRGSTPYVRWGNAPVLVLMLALLLTARVVGARVSQSR